MTMDKQQERLGSGKKHAPRDNIDLDVIDALAMGYGCQYGRYKADHPCTKEVNEARLDAIKKGHATSPAYKPIRAEKYTVACEWCGAKFPAPDPRRKYCGSVCKSRAKTARKNKKEVTV